VNQLNSRPTWRGPAAALLALTTWLAAYAGPTRAASTPAYELAPLGSAGAPARRLVARMDGPSSVRPPPPAAGGRAPAARPRLMAPTVSRAVLAGARAVPYAAGLGIAAQRDPGDVRPGPAAQATAAGLGRSFESIDENNCDCAPADSTVAAGSGQVVTAVNTAWVAFDKGGNQLTAVMQLADWFSPIFADPQAVYSSPRVLYDQFSRRFVLIALATDFQANDSRVLISVSPVGTVLGNWFLMKLDPRVTGNLATATFIDFAGLGVDSRAVYVTGNMFDFGSQLFRTAKVFILDKAQLYRGGVRGSVVWDLIDASGERVFSIQPAHVYGSTSAGFLVNARVPGRDTVRGMTIWAVSNPTTRPRLQKQFVPTGAYSAPPPGQQPPDVDNTLLDMGDGRLYNAVYRNGSIFTAHATAVDWGDRVPVAALHYLEIRISNGRPAKELYFGGPGKAYGWPAIMPDTFGNLAIVFNRSGSTEYASLRFATRRAFDPGSQLRGSESLAAGSGQLLLGDPGLALLGNYNGIAVDGDTQRSIWLYGMYAAGQDFWSTRVGEVAP
jgi:hypothetical protein